MGDITRGKILRDDLFLYDGVTRTNSRVDATGGTVTGLNIGDVVDVLQVFGSGTSRSVITINAAVGRLGGAEATFLFTTGTWTIDDDVTIPSTIVSHIPAGCIFDVSNTKTITFSGPVVADSATHSSGAGTVSIGATSDAVIASVPWFKRTADEIAAAVTPTNYQFEPGHLLRYGTNTTPGTTDMTTVFQACADVCAQGGLEMLIPSVDGAQSEYKTTAKINCTDSISIRGIGSEKPRIVCDACDGFDYTTKGVQHVNIQNIHLTQLILHTTTPNTFFAIKFQGATAAADRPAYDNISNIFINGFGSAIEWEWCGDQRIEGITTVNCGKIVVAIGQCVNNWIENNHLGGNLTAITAGDATNTVEGWHVNRNLFFGNLGSIDAIGGAAFHFNGNTLDHQLGSSTAVLFRSAGALPSFGHSINDNYIAFTTSGTGNEGIRLLNSVASGSNNGNVVSNNQIFAYSGGALTAGILVDGTQEKENRIHNNSVNATTDLKISAGTNHIVTDNIWLGGGLNTTVELEYNGNIGTIITSITLLKKSVATRTEYFNTAQPASGTFVIGDVAWNTSPSIDGNNMAILGWLRLVSGSSHVAGTDWSIMYVSHVTPAT